MLERAGRVRRAPTPGGIARRRLLVVLTKWSLPFAALALLGTVALWPELERARDQAHIAFRRVTGHVDGAELSDARYRGVDEKGRPYTVTAAAARQSGPERIDLTTPKGDITLENGTWLMVQSRAGVYMQKADQLDLSHDVVLYRDDGTTMRTQSASIDLKAGAAAGSETVHADGPFGTLDATGFTLTDKGTIIQFSGPARLVLNSRNP
jgi:lipopolysaccharide export system protein LptC